MASVELALHQLQTPEVNGVRFDDVISAGERIPGMAALWDEATPEERRDMVMLLLEPGGLYYDLELKLIAALKPRPAFLPVLRMLTGVVEYDEVKGILVTENWQDRNRRASSHRSLPAPHQLPLTSCRCVALATSTCKHRHCSRKQCQSSTSLCFPSTH